MSYAVKEIFYTLQGEGAQTGRAAVFCRFSGCNLWSGRDEDRATAICRFCDTDFADTNGPGGGKFGSAEELAAAVEEKWMVRAFPPFEHGLLEGWGTQNYSTADPSTRSLRELAQDGSAEGSAIGSKTKPDRSRKFVVCTGGEPLLQLDALLIDALHVRGFEIAVETNGTVAAPQGIDWLCVSPKAGAALHQTSGDELKIVYPQPEAEPERFESLNFRHFFLQPMDGPQRVRNTEIALRYCLEHPQWRLSLQTHKMLGIP
jgi:7-carboxy-7-deazaguanine synthase